MDWVTDTTLDPDWLSKKLKDYSYEELLELLAIFEYLEEYEDCAKIRDEIKTRDTQTETM